jgi:MinD-like ATPase involved in chromosome partitioning or flagellar assembly
VVAGATGGIGTSTVAALLALALAQSGRQTLLVDTDEVVGAQHRILGVSVAAGLAALIDPRTSVEDLLTEVAAGCVLLPGGEAPDPRAIPLDPTARRAIMRRIAQRYDAHDAVVIDAGSRLDGILAAAEPGVRRMLIVGGVTPVAIASAYAVVKTVEARWPGLAIDVLFNRQEASAGCAAFEHVQKGTAQFLGRTVGFAGVLPDDAALPSAADLPLHRCSRATDLALQQLAASLLTDASPALRA